MSGWYRAAGLSEYQARRPTVRNPPMSATNGAAPRRWRSRRMEAACRTRPLYFQKMRKVQLRVIYYCFASVASNRTTPHHSGRAQGAGLRLRRQGSLGPTLFLHSILRPCLLLFLAHGHPVPHPWPGDDVPGVGGVVPQLAPQPLYHVPQQPTLAHPLRAPHPLEQNLVVQHPGGVHRQFVEHRVLRGPPRCPACCSSPARVHRQRQHPPKDLGGTIVTSVP